MADEITVGGITVPLTHPGKVLFPADGHEPSVHLPFAPAPRG